LWLLEQLNTPEMTRYVGGPETSEELVARQARYEKPDSRQHRIVSDLDGEDAGWVGYWETTWGDQPVWEVGWAIVPPFQGRGVATSATARVVELARAERRFRWMHAFPMVANTPSNALCRTLGFSLMDEVDFPARRGGTIRCNNWRLDLFTTN
jgi:RimJ/RimL family protein N-acetyltransferase